MTDYHPNVGSLTSTFLLVQEATPLSPTGHAACMSLEEGEEYACMCMYTYVHEVKPCSREELVLLVDLEYSHSFH